MSVRQSFKVVSGDAPDSETAASIGTASGLEKIPLLTVSAKFAGNTGGTLDVYLQRYDDALEEWIDWAHFPQAASGASTARYSFSAPAQGTTINAVGADSSPTISANTYVGGHPGDQVRVWCDSGASTTEGATVTVSFSGLTQ